MEGELRKKVWEVTMLMNGQVMRWEWPEPETSISCSFVKVSFGLAAVFWGEDVLGVDVFEILNKKGMF